MTRMVEIARRHKLFVLEDCALALGTRIDGTHAGLFGDAGVFSFYPVKHITTAEGGMIITRDAQLAASLKLRKAFGVDRSHAERKVPGTYDVVASTARASYGQSGTPANRSSGVRTNVTPPAVSVDLRHEPHSVALVHQRPPRPPRPGGAGAHRSIRRGLRGGGAGAGARAGGPTGRRPGRLAAASAGSSQRLTRCSGSSAGRTARPRCRRAP